MWALKHMFIIRRNPQYMVDLNSVNIVMSRDKYNSPARHFVMNEKDIIC